MCAHVRSYQVHVCILLNIQQGCLSNQHSNKHFPMNGKRKPVTVRIKIKIVRNTLVKKLKVKRIKINSLVTRCVNLAVLVKN